MKASTKYHETSIYLPVAPPNIPNIIDAIPNTVLSIAPAGPIIPATAAIISNPPVTTSVQAPPLIPCTMTINPEPAALTLSINGGSSCI